jgi:hypothetical protein
VSSRASSVRILNPSGAPGARVFPGIIGRWPRVPNGLATCTLIDRVWVIQAPALSKELLI